ncbi:hypothetical protein JTE90_016638 [Oedothorax gibbosus]|uniref:Uncharacterized protein n=1 Tax=Oedothorax gibbosus TaxID=931172 RepID=A0AAV6U4L0_9ARAC|nr:hypothetical protein JTE90_016638 [Oedothorax gibbosus]
MVHFTSLSGTVSDTTSTSLMQKTRQVTDIHQTVTGSRFEVSKPEIFPLMEILVQISVSFGMRLGRDAMFLLILLE